MTSTAVHTILIRRLTPTMAQKGNDNKIFVNLPARVEFFELRKINPVMLNNFKYYININTLRKGNERDCNIGILQRILHQFENIMADKVIFNWNFIK